MPISRMRRPAARRGLTLMELIVVLAILVALAAILIPLCSTASRRIAGSTGSPTTNA